MSSSEGTGARESFSELFQVPQLPLISMRDAKSQLRVFVSKGRLPCLLLATLLRLAQPSHVFAQGPDQDNQFWVCRRSNGFTFH